MKRGTPDHPKTLALMQHLQVSRVTAVGILEMLWHFAAGYARRGDIGRYSDEQIASGLDWDGPAEDLVAALVVAGWLDTHRRHRLLVHDWPEHADDAVHRALARAKTRFADGQIPKLTRLSAKERKEIEAAFRAPKRRTRGALPEPRQGQSQSPTPKSVPPTRGDSWSREACDDWIERFDGTAPGARIGKALKPLVSKHGWPDVRRAWRAYLAQAEAEYASAQRFAATFGRWAGTSSEPRAGPKRAGVDEGVDRLMRKAADAAKRELPFGEGGR